MKSKGALVFIEKRKIFWGLLEDQLYTVGRSSSDDFFLASKGISRTHASICLRGDSFWIIDGSIKGNSSTNGLFVNGEKVSLHRLKTHDIITFHKDSKAIFFDQKDSLKFDDEFSSFLNHLTTFLSQDAENTSEAKT
ncbi:MAG: FHA domain-containing protein [Cyanobacteria bacterium]|nr:FHA domain-containing protein [Cyanobacteriota bacterium]